MATMGKDTIGFRAQEFQEGLKDVTAFGPKEAYMQATLLVGKAASLATHLKGLNYVDDIQALTYLAAELGISGIELKTVLNELQEVDFATVVSAPTGIKRVELRIPELRNGYENLGERWFQLSPSEIERAAIATLENVAQYPLSQASFQKFLNLDERAFGTVIDIGVAGALLDRYTASDGEVLLYSPLTVEEKPEALLQLKDRFPRNQIVSALSAVQSQQGMPIEHLTSSYQPVLAEGVLSGALCPVQIVTGSKSHTFVFSPRGGLRKEERVILEKARAILACVRCGQHYADQRPILYPRRILETLRDNKGFAYPRPDFPEQYGLLVTKQIGHIDEHTRRPGFYNFHLYDTPENLQALNVAIDLLEYGETPTSRLETDAKEFLSVAGTFSGTLPTRTRMSRNAVRSKETSRDIIAEISKLARGVVK